MQSGGPHLDPEKKMRRGERLRAADHIWGNATSCQVSGLLMI